MTETALCRAEQTNRIAREPDRVSPEAYGEGCDVGIIGAAGNDVAVGVDGNDVLADGHGADRFRFDSDDGADVITDTSAIQSGEVVLAGGGTHSLNGTLLTGGLTSVAASNGHDWTARNIRLG